MSATAPSPHSSRGLAVLVGSLSGVMAHLPFIAIGRAGFPSVAFAAMGCFFVGDPWLSLPVAFLARRGRLSRMDGVLAGAVSGGIAAGIVALSMISRGRGGADVPATLIYPVLTTVYGYAAAWLGTHLRRRDDS